MAENSYASRDLLVRGIAAAKSGETREARFFLEWYISQDPPYSDRNSALYYLSLINPDEAEKRKYLELILDTDPVDGRARRDLAILNGELKAEDVIDPDKLPNQHSRVVNNDDPSRFICPKCGGRMTFTPDGQSLICEYCSVRSPQKNNHQSVADENFMIALATAKGHSQAFNTQVIHCQGCAAEFIVPPKQLSWQCPYCQSNYKIEQMESREVIEPKSLIPFYVSPREAKRIVRTWLEESDSTQQGVLTTLQGLYIPAWTFDVGGYISWTYQVQEKREWVTKQDQKALFHDDILVPASKKWQEWMSSLLDSYDLHQLTAFDYGYLANWIAETYQINAGDAALHAREIALQRERQLIQDYDMRSLREITINSNRMTVEQYKLILLPVWSGLLTLGQIQLQVLLNGQNGQLITPPPKRGSLTEWLSHLFG